MAIGTCKFCGVTALAGGPVRDRIDGIRDIHVIVCCYCNRCQECGFTHDVTDERTMRQCPPLYLTEPYTTGRHEP